MLRTYPHYFSPEEHPDYPTRQVKPVTRDDLGNAIQFTSLRVFSIDSDNRLIHFKDDIDLYATELGIGKVIWPFNKALFTTNFNDLVDDIADKGYWLFDFWGYVPGSSPDEQAWGQYKVPPETLAYLKSRLGTHFLGMDNGEQDGRYVGSYAPLACPADTDRKAQYLAFHRHFDRMGEDLGHHISVLCSLSFPHYFARQGGTTIIGAETAQALINTNLWYAYIRGAGKQYGLLWFGNASIWNRWGYKAYESTGGEGNYSWGPDSGTTLGLLKRLLYAEYLYNGDILGFEQSWVLGDNTEKRLQGLPTPMETDDSTKVLTPVGALQVEAATNIGRWGYPGPMHTPVAVVLDWANGWVPPRHLYSGRTHQAWGNLPYSEADHQLHALFTMLYPGYEDSGFHRDERGFLASTPFTDCADVLFSDVRAETLAAYNVVILAGEHSVDCELLDKLKAFVEGGGTLVAFGQAAESFAGAADRDGPQVTQTSQGMGQVIAVHSPYGLESVRPLPGSPLPNQTGETLPIFMDFAAPVKAAISEVLQGQRIVWSDNVQLMVTVNLTDRPDQFLVGVFNNTQSDQDFHLMSADGCAIASSETLSSSGLSEATLDAGGMAVMRVTASRPCGEPAAKVAFPTDARKGIRCNLSNPKSLSEAILCLPTLGHWFEGAKVDARYIEERDIDFLSKEGGIIGRQGLRLTVDMSSMVNLFPDLTLIDNIPSAYEASMRRVRSILEKSSRLPVDSLVLCLHRVPENHFSHGQAVESSMAGLAQVCREASRHGMEVFLRNAHGRPFQSPAETQAFIADVSGRFGLQNLHMAYDMGHAAISGFGDPPPGGTGMVLLSAPLVDGFGQAHDCHLPVAGSQWEEAMMEQAAGLHARGATICLDSVHRSWDDTYREAKRFGECRETLIRR